MLCVSANSIGSPRSNPRIGARRIEKKNEKNRSRGNVLKLSHRCIAYHVRLTDTASISPPGPKNGASQIENKRNMRDSEDVPNRLIASNCLDVSDCLTLVNGGLTPNRHNREVIYQRVSKDSIHPEPVEASFMVRQAHHERSRFTCMTPSRTAASQLNSRRIYSLSGSWMEKRQSMEARALTGQSHADAVADNYGENTLIGQLPCLECSGNWRCAERLERIVPELVVSIQHPSDRLSAGVCLVKCHLSDERVYGSRFTSTCNEPATWIARAVAYVTPSVHPARPSLNGRPSATNLGCLVSAS